MLRWQHDWADKAAHWEEVLARGRPAPEPFCDRPEVLPVAEFYWKSFHILMTERQNGMGVGYIPYSKARLYAADRGITDGDRFARFWTIIHAVDCESVKISNAASKDVTDDGAKKKRKGKGRLKP